MRSRVVARKHSEDTYTNVQSVIFLSHATIHAEIATVPKCQGGEIAKWLRARQSELLPVPYFHSVFTVPHELNGVFLQNQALMFDMLFQAVSETLMQAARSRYGGKAGFFGVLHSWGQKMEFHPHIHCVIPGVVLKDDGTIIESPKNYFIPDRILSKVFRGIFLSKLEASHSKLRFIGNYAHLSSFLEFKKLLRLTTQKSWVVYSKKPFAGPTAVLKYLSRYTHRVAISNKRLRSFKDGVVTFSIKDYAAKKKRVTQIRASEFVRRSLTT